MESVRARDGRRAAHDPRRNRRPYVKRDREYVVNEVLVANAAGQIVSRSRTHQSFLLPEQTKEGFVVDKSREKDSSRSFKIGERGGDPIDAPMRKIDEEMCMAFSGPARNYHNDKQKAVELGFPEIVVQGMLSVCLVAEMMTKRFGLGFLYGGKMDLRLVNVVWGNDRTGPKGLIVERHPEGKRITRRGRGMVRQGRRRQNHRRQRQRSRTVKDPLCARKQYSIGIAVVSVRRRMRQSMRLRADQMPVPMQSQLPGLRTTW